MRFFLLFLLFFGSQLVNAQQVIKLFDGVPPGSENATWSEATSTQNMFNTEVVYNVKEPTITAYFPEKHLNTGTAIIIAPGGAFHTLSINNEGVDVAKWLNSKGVSAFVLKYRVAPSFTDDPVKELMPKMSNFEALDKENEPYVKLATADGLKAVEYVRAHAKEMEINPDKIGFMGFSAGGTLTMSVVYNATAKNRPNFVAPIYAYEPAIIGSKIPEEKTPIFVCVAGDDQLKMMPMSISIYKKWYDAGQPAELHIYEKGGHGFGMHEQKLPVDGWYERFGDWLRMQGLRDKLRPGKYEKMYGEAEVEKGERMAAERLRRNFGGMDRYKEANAALGGKPQKVVFLGNSITEGWYHQDEDFFKRNQFVGRGISGQTSSQLLVRFRQDVVDLNPEKVIIHIGTNDVAENTGPYNEDFTIGNIESMIDIAEKNGIEVLIASVLPATKFEWRLGLGDRSGEIVKLNERLKVLANERGLKYIDYHSAMKNEANGLPPELAEDGVHPTAAGFKIMEKLVLEALN